MSAVSSLFSVPMKLGGWLDDRMNPIVVKELRQAVKSRFVIAMLMLMLSVLLIILMIALISQDQSRGVDENAGAGLFLIFQGILLATCMLFVPVYVGVRLAAERSSATSDLLYVTTIRPSSIVWGKLLAGMVVTALTFSACAPFMVITYLLRGIDLPTILFILGLDALIVLAATQLAIFVGTMPIGWPVKTLLGLLLLAASVSGFSVMTGWVSFSLMGFGVGSFMDEPGFWLGFGAFVGGWLAGIAMVFFLSVAMISPVTANRAFVPRLYFTTVWALTFAGMVYLSAYFGDIDPLEIWLVFAMVLLVFAAILSAGERETYGPRLKHSIPRAAVLRVPAFFFYSGAAGGLLWTGLLFWVSLIAVAIASGVLADNWFGIGHGYYGGFMDDGWMSRCVSMMAWVYGYLLLAVVICRRALRLKNGAVVTGVVGLIIMAAVSIVPMIIAFALDPDRWDFNVEFWLLLNPFGPVFCNQSDWESAYGRLALPSSVIFFGIMMLVNIPWFLRQIKNFAPPSNLAVKPANAPAFASQPAVVDPEQRGAEPGENADVIDG